MIGVGAFQLASSHVRGPEDSSEVLRDGSYEKMQGKVVKEIRLKQKETKLYTNEKCNQNAKCIHNSD